MAWVRSTLGFHPEMVPSTVANRKMLGPVLGTPFTTSETLKPPALGSWYTVPVAGPFGALMDGTLTTSEKGVTGEVEVSYRVLVPVPSLATHHSPVGLADSPHGLTKFGSWIWAGVTEVSSDTRLVCTMADDSRRRTSSDSSRDRGHGGWPGEDCVRLRGEDAELFQFRSEDENHMIFLLSGVDLRYNGKPSPRRADQAPR
jgi:hypothetical protein